MTQARERASDRRGQAGWPAWPSQYVAVNVASPIAVAKLRPQAYVRVRSNTDCAYAHAIGSVGRADDMVTA